LSNTVPYTITNKISAIFGKFANTRFPSLIQNIVNIGYVKLMGLDMREFQSPSSYPTLNKLFIRALSTPRTFDNSDASFISPCDSLISDHGVIQNETAFQIKGMQYSIRGLLNKIHPGHIDDLEGGNYMNFYLSPKDYHRYHIPIDCKISRLVHVPGKLYPVNMTYLNKQQDLFIENERAIVECIDVTGRYFYLVFVGALNVGQIVLHFEPSLKTNLPNEVKVYDYDNVNYKKGDELGMFKMGSTIAALFPAGMLDPEVSVGEDVKFAQTIAEVNY
jgi:phosphatidylserine decarboxylase